MCHLIFFLPVFGLPVFWFFPFKTALVVYLIICAVSIVAILQSLPGAAQQGLHRQRGHVG